MFAVAATAAIKVSPSSRSRIYHSRAGPPTALATETLPI